MQTEQTLMEASEQWRKRPADERFETLNDLQNFLAIRRNHSRSQDIVTESLRLSNDADTLLINAEDGKLINAEPTHYSFGQFAQIIGAPGGYLRTLPRPLLLENLQHGLTQTPREELKFMTVDHPDGKTNLQAITSTTYGRIWDADVAKAVGELVALSGGKWHNPIAYDPYGTGLVKPSGLYASDHDVFIFMIDGDSILEAGPRAKINRGFIAWNSETGAKTFGLMTFLFNAICGNHIVWGASEVNRLLIRHSSGGPARFTDEGMRVLRGHLEAPAAPIEAAIRKAQEVIIIGYKDSISAAIAWREWSANHGVKFTTKEIQSGVDFAKAEEGEARTLWQFVQGLTAYARGFDWMDTRLDLERRAGKLLDAVN